MEAAGPARPHLGTEPHPQGLLRRGTEWDLTVPRASETNPHKSHTVKGLTHTQSDTLTAKELQFTWTRRATCTRPTHISTGPDRDPRDTEAGRTASHTRSTGSCLFGVIGGVCSLRPLYPLERDGHHPGAPDWSLLLPVTY